jgi:hypothetical protein
MCVGHTNSTHTTANSLISTTIHLYMFRSPLGHHQKVFHHQQVTKSRLIEICLAMSLNYVNRRSVSARSKTRSCDRSFTGIAGLNPAEGIDACLLRVLFVIRYSSLRRADRSSREVPPTMVCLSVKVEPR